MTFELDEGSPALVVRNDQGDTVIRISEDDLTSWIFYNEDPGHIFNGSKSLARELASLMIEKASYRSRLFGDHIVVA